MFYISKSLAAYIQPSHNIFRKTLLFLCYYFFFCNFKRKAWAEESILSEISL
jgi:hypothetical protein